MARLLSNLDGNALRGARYLRGMVLTSKPYTKALTGAAMMANGAVVFDIKPEDLSDIDGTNVVGTGILASIYNGTPIEVFTVGADDKPVRQDYAAPQSSNLDDVNKVSRQTGKNQLTTLKILEEMQPLQVELLSNIRHVAVPGRMILEAEMGFAPYILVGYAVQESLEIKWVRLSLQTHHQNIQRWLGEVVRVMRSQVF